MKSRPFAWLGLVLLSSAVTPLFARAECDRPVDPKRAVIFAGLNEAFIERKAAEDAACLRGETFFSLVPSLTGEDLAVSAFFEMNRIQKQIGRLGERTDQTSPENQARLSELKAAFAAAEKIYTPYWNLLMTETRKKTLATELLLLIQKLANDNVVLSTLVLSGHSAGGGVYGALGRLEFEPIRGALKGSYEGKKDLLADLEQVLLWGCNTMNPYDGGNRWLKSLPNLKMIFGFQGSAPGAKNPAAPALLKSAMLSISRLRPILGLSDPTPAMKTLFDSLSGIEYTIGSAYVNIPEKSRGYYYERKTAIKNTPGQPSVQTWISSISPAMSEAQCELVRAEVTADQAIAQKIFDGELQIPEDTGSGYLRELYTRARRNEVCRRFFNLAYTADQVGYLLFWHGVKKNAARYIEGKIAPIITEFEKSIQSMDLEPVVRAFNEDMAAIRKKSLEEQTRSSHHLQVEIDRLDHLFSIVQDEADTLPWGKRHERRLKRMLRKLDRLTNKISKRVQYAELYERYRLMEKLKSASGPDVTEKLKQIYGGLEVQRQTLEDQKKAIDEAVKELRVRPAPPETVASVREKLGSLIEAAGALRLSQIENLGYADLKERVKAAQEKSGALYKQFGLSSATGNLRYLVSRMDYAFTIYSKLAVSVTPACLTFESWHEYVETPTGGVLPQTGCF